MTRTRKDFIKYIDGLRKENRRLENQLTLTHVLEDKIQANINERLGIREETLTIAKNNTNSNWTPPPGAIPINWPPEDHPENRQLSTIIEEKCVAPDKKIDVKTKIKEMQKKTKASSTDDSDDDAKVMEALRGKIKSRLNNQTLAIQVENLTSKSEVLATKFNDYKFKTDREISKLRNELRKSNTVEDLANVKRGQEKLLKVCDEIQQKYVEQMRDVVETTRNIQENYAYFFEQNKRLASEVVELKKKVQSAFSLIGDLNQGLILKSPSLACLANSVGDSFAQRPSKLKNKFSDIVAHLNQTNLPDIPRINDVLKDIPLRLASLTESVCKLAEDCKTTDEIENQHRNELTDELILSDIFFIKHPTRE